MNALLRLPGRCLTALRDLLRREDGTATMDFVIMVPLFMWLFISGFEVSFIMIRQLMLERGVDLAVRDLRLGKWPNLSTTILKEAICDHTGKFIGDCENQLMLELVKVPSTNWTLPDANAKCVDRSEEIQPVTSFEPGTQNEMVIIRACILVDPFFPGTELALMLEAAPGDGLSLITTSAFVNEPGTGS